MPLSKVCYLKLLHRWVLRLGRGTCVGKKSGGCRRLASTYAGYVSFASRANPRFFRIYSQLFLSCSCRHSRPVNCAHTLPLYCVRCYTLPDPCASIAATATSPRRPRTVLCNSRSYNSRTLAGCPRCHVWHAQRTWLLFDRFDVLIANSVSISLFSYIDQLRSYSVGQTDIIASDTQLCGWRDTWIKVCVNVETHYNRHCLLTLYPEGVCKIVLKLEDLGLLGLITLSQLYMLQTTHNSHCCLPISLNLTKTFPTIRSHPIASTTTFAWPLLSFYCTYISIHAMLQIFQQIHTFH